MIGIYEAKTREEAETAFDALTTHIPVGLRDRLKNGTLTNDEFDNDYLYVPIQAWEYIQRKFPAMAQAA
jgi:hypothetical protein